MVEREKATIPFCYVMESTETMMAHDTRKGGLLMVTMKSNGASNGARNGARNGASNGSTAIDEKQGNHLMVVRSIIASIVHITYTVLKSG